MTDLDRKREAAIDRINAKRDFKIHAAVFMVANLVFVLALDRTGVILLADLAVPRLGPRAKLPCVVRLAPKRPISEDEIEREMHKVA